ncbi:MAG: hypothetical protein R3E89_07750 [Thiolinea sp.]
MPDQFLLLGGERLLVSLLLLSSLGSQLLVLLLKAGAVLCSLFPFSLQRQLFPQLMQLQLQAGNLLLVLLQDAEVLGIALLLGTQLLLLVLQLFQNLLLFAVQRCEAGAVILSLLQRGQTRAQIFQFQAAALSLFQLWQQLLLQAVMLAGGLLVALLCLGVGLLLAVMAGVRLL